VIRQNKVQQVRVKTPFMEVIMFRNRILHSLVASTRGMNESIIEEGNLPKRIYGVNFMSFVLDQSKKHKLFPEFPHVEMDSLVVNVSLVSNPAVMVVVYHDCVRGISLSVRSVRSLISNTVYYLGLNST
jgi:hypothetical protein